MPIRVKEALTRVLTTGTAVNVASIFLGLNDSDYHWLAKKLGCSLVNIPRHRYAGWLGARLAGHAAQELLKGDNHE